MDFSICNAVQGFEFIVSQVYAKHCIHWNMPSVTQTPSFNPQFSFTKTIKPIQNNVIFLIDFLQEASPFPPMIDLIAIQAISRQSWLLILPNT